MMLHGGDLARAEQMFGAPQKGWLDLSTGISPYAYDTSAISPHDWKVLPGKAEENALIGAARQAYGAADACIVAAPGTQILIQQLPHVCKTSRVAVRTPTYNEHAHCWRLAGHAVDEYSFDDLPDSAGVVIVVNPNNPDGRALGPDTLLGWAGRMAARGGLLVVDEAFADTDPSLSIASHAARPGLVVLRSFGKFFGLAGLRLGFALTGNRIADGLLARLGPWAVSGPALAIGQAALSDMDWQNAMRARLADDAGRLDLVLGERGFDVIGGTSLFRLAEHEYATGIYQGLGRAGILVRPFEHRPGWLRFGLPGGALEWARLSAALDDAVG